MTRTQTTSYGKICVNHYTTVVAGGNILAQKKNRSWIEILDTTLTLYAIPYKITEINLTS